MQLQFVKAYRSLHDFPSTGDIPNFIVLTGPNGAGKSQVLEAIRANAILGDWLQHPRAVRMLTTAELAVHGDLPGANETREQLVDRFEGEIRQRLTDGATFPHPAMIPNLHNRLVLEGVLSQSSIARVEAEAGKRLWEWNRSDFVKFTPVEVGFADPFALAVGDVFSRYRQIQTLNGYNRWRASEFGESTHWVTDEEFVIRNGPPPWDLLNSALAKVSLQYRFEAPEVSMSQTMSEPRLKDVGSGQEIGAGSLSSGEKTLLMIAMSLYSVVHRRDSISMPEVLLLDEPDATLHPSMIRSLLELLQDEFVGRHGVRVIITTHSPTTVALAPEESLYMMEREGPRRFRKAPSKDFALSRLLVGVPSLSVRAEHRRVVVVESPNDERLYARIQDLLRPLVASERSLAFMPAGGAGRSDGCAAVVDLVRQLRDRGNVAVWGLVDRDAQVSEPHEYVFFDKTRYSIENVILDPLSIGLLLLQEMNPVIAGQMSPVDYLGFDISSHGQQLVDVVVAVVAKPDDDLTSVSVPYGDGVVLHVPFFWINMRGHDLEEDRILAAFPPLREHRSRLMDRIVDRVWGARPGCIPQSTVELYRRLLD